MAVGCRAVQAAEEKAFPDILQRSPESKIQTASTISDTLTLEGAQVKYTTLLQAKAAWTP